MGLIDQLGNWIAGKIASAMQRQMVDSSINAPVVKARAYRLGEQPKQLKVAARQFDDNITVNLTGLIANRIVSSMIGEKLEFRIEGNDAAKEWLDACWDANHKEILLYKSALTAGEAGTGYLFIQPDVEGSGGMLGDDGVWYPRLIVQDPVFMSMDTLPEDFEVVTKYTKEYKFDLLGKEVARRRVIENVPDTNTWVIVDYELSAATGNRWQEVDRIEWPHEWSPIVHWQNLPAIGSAYGLPDISGDVEVIQDRINFLMANLSKLIRLYAHPQTVGQNIQLQMRKDPETGIETPVLEMGPDKMLMVQSGGEAGASVYNLAQVGDLAGAIAYAKILRQSFFDIARVVDIDSLEDKLGSLTNFALHVIYQDQSNMIATKRELLGDALEEINRHLLELGGFAGVQTEVIWPETVPQNEAEIATYYETLQRLGVVDKQTIAEELNLPWEVIQERLKDEQQENENLGAFLMRMESRGQGPQFGRQQQAPPNGGGGGNSNPFGK